MAGKGDRDGRTYGSMASSTIRLYMLNRMCKKFTAAKQAQRGELASQRVRKQGKSKENA